MELPHLGKNCALSSCNQLDFLPVKCDACSKVFCIQHYRYDTHNCEKSKSKDVQVPVCPLCSEPVACRGGQLPDYAVSQHIDQFCKRNSMIKGRPNKPSTNLQSCSFSRCKQKDLIYLECGDCRSKFCIKHRHPSDHSCPGPPLVSTQTWNTFRGSCSSSASSGFEMIKNKAQQISKSGQAALNRLSNSNNNDTRHRNQAMNSGQLVGALQGSLTEQEALAIALNESKANGASQVPRSQEDEDLALARALHQSEVEARNQGLNRNRGSGNKDSCIIG